MKKGQLSLFLIIGIVIVASFAIIYYALQEKSPGITASDDMDPEIINYVSVCMENSLSKNLPVLSMQGGFINVPEPKLTIMGFEIPVVNEEFTLEGLSADLSDLIIPEIKECLQTSDFPTLDYGKFDDFSVASEILGSTLLINSLFRYDGLGYEVNVEDETSLGELLPIANEIIRLWVNDGFVDILQIPIIEFNNDVSIELIEFGSSTVYYIEREDAYFAFALEE